MFVTMQYRGEPSKDSSIDCGAKGTVKPRLVNVPSHSWVKEFPGAITVCDSRGIILEMNAKAVENFKQDGGRKLIGKNLFDCHPEPARTKLKDLMEKQQVKK